MANFIFPTPYIPDPDSGRPISNAKLYFGQPNLDPRILANQVQVTILQEDGSTIQVSQPIRTGSGGVPEYDGSPVIIAITEATVSFAVDDANDQQKYYFEKSNTETIIPGTIIYNDNVTFNANVDLTSATIIGLDADEVDYDNTISGLAATNVQAAIDEIDAQVDQNTSDIAGLLSGQATKGYLFGIDTSSSDGGTVDLTDGECADSTGAQVLSVSAQNIDSKNRISAGGNLAGAASPSADTSYFIYVVGEADGSNPRLAFDTNSAASNALSEWSTQTGNTYTLYRLIGFAVMDSSANVRAFTHKSNVWSLNVPVQSTVVTSTTTNIWSIAISTAGGIGAVPAGIDLNPTGVLKAYDASAVMYGLITTDYQADTAPTVSLSSFALNTQGPVSCALDQYISNGTIRVRFSSASSVDFAVLVNGWKYNR